MHYHITFFAIFLQNRPTKVEPGGSNGEAAVVKVSLQKSAVFTVVDQVVRLAELLIKRD